MPGKTGRARYFFLHLSQERDTLNGEEFYTLILYINTLFTFIYVLVIFPENVASLLYA